MCTCHETFQNMLFLVVVINVCMRCGYYMMRLVSNNILIMSPHQSGFLQKLHTLPYEPSGS